MGRGADIADIFPSGDEGEAFVWGEVVWNEPFNGTIFQDFASFLGSKGRNANGNRRNFLFFGNSLSNFCFYFLTFCPFVMTVFGLWHYRRFVFRPFVTTSSRHCKRESVTCNMFTLLRTTGLRQRPKNKMSKRQKVERRKVERQKVERMKRQKPNCTKRPNVKKTKCRKNKKSIGHKVEKTKGRNLNALCSFSFLH